jgi:cardiolipin synthase
LTGSTVAIAFSLIVIVFVLYRTLWVTPISFHGAEPVDLEHPHAAHVVGAVADANVSEGNSLEVLINGSKFYPAELEAMRHARSSINAEFYVFKIGEVADQLIDVMCERSRARVRVHLLVDGFGSARFGMLRGRLRKLRAAGCEVRFYHPFTPRFLDKINIRTHRDIIVVDGRVAFVGGAGVADHWRFPVKSDPWRDMMIRVDGRAVVSLQGTFVENWVEAGGDALISDSYFPICDNPGETQVLVINSSSRGRSSYTQILHRLLLISARRSISIVTPYFLPDRGVRREIASASRRGVKVRILTVGSKTNLSLVRAGGRRIYGELLKAGVEIFEYEPGMFHVKMLLVDDLWAVTGTTNFDNRSFMINDEINLAVAEREFCGRLLESVTGDIAKSTPITLDRWESRPMSQRIWEQISRVLERQQ